MKQSSNTVAMDLGVCHRQNLFGALVVRTHVACDTHAVEEWRHKTPLTADQQHQEVSVDSLQKWNESSLLTFVSALTLIAFLHDFIFSPAALNTCANSCGEGSSSLVRHAAVLGDNSVSILQLIPCEAKCMQH